MANLADQLRSVKLKKVPDEMVKDFSHPKTAGFMTQEEITDYQSSVLDVNFEEWMDILSELTFTSKLLKMSKPEAELFVSLYQRLYSNLDPSAISKVQWRDSLTSLESELVTSMQNNLQDVIDFFLQGDENNSVFVKLSSRSPKDAPMAQERFQTLYKSFLAKEEKMSQQSENTKITCILRAGFEALKVKTAGEVIDMCIRSERVYQDLLLALAVPERFRENWVIRKFVEIDVDMEFRGFVYGQTLTALSQYNYLIYSQRLVDEKSKFLQLILTFFNDCVKPKMDNFVPNYIIDFAVCDDGKKIWIIEINPFLVTTDAGLFSWEHEMLLLQGSQCDVQFRVMEKPRPGATAMLPRGMKDLIVQCVPDQTDN